MAELGFKTDAFCIFIFAYFFNGTSPIGDNYRPCRAFVFSSVRAIVEGEAGLSPRRKDIFPNIGLFFCFVKRKIFVAVRIAVYVHCIRVEIR
jgi:hypothetical protein